MRRSVCTLGTVMVMLVGLAVPVAATPIPVGVTPASSLPVPARAEGMAFDANGTLFATNPAINEVSVFEPGASARNEAKTLKGCAIPRGVAVNPNNGEVLVACSAADSVVVFDRDLRVVRLLMGVPAPVGVAISRSGEILVSSSSSHYLYVYRGNSTSWSRLIDVGFLPWGVAADPTADVVYVVLKDRNLVASFATDSGIILSMVTVTNPTGVALQPQSGLIFATDMLGGRVRAFARGTTQVLDAHELSGVQQPMGVAVDPLTGRVLVGGSEYPPRVTVYPPLVSAVSGVVPSAGSVTGGTAVTISGSNLGTVTQVQFGGVAATKVVAVSPTTVTAVTPARDAGNVDVTVGWGSTTATGPSAFAYTPVAPDRASGTVGVPGNGQVTVRWTAPAFTGGVPVAGYTVTPSPGGAPCATSGTTCTIAGLTNGQRYRFTVTTTNTAGLSSVSEPSAEVAPYIPVKQKVKAKSARSKLPRKGSATAVNWVKRPTYAKATLVSATCTDGTARASAELCTFKLYRTGKVKVRTKGFRGVRVTIGLQSVPTARAPAQYGPSAVWTRTWTVR